MHTCTQTKKTDSTSTKNYEVVNLRGFFFAKWLLSLHLQPTSWPDTLCQQTHIGKKMDSWKEKCATINFFCNVVHLVNEQFEWIVDCLDWCFGWLCVGDWLFDGLIDRLFFICCHVCFFWLLCCLNELIDGLVWLIHLIDGLVDGFDWLMAVIDWWEGLIDWLVGLIGWWTDCLIVW